MLIEVLCRKLSLLEDKELEQVAIDVRVLMSHHYSVMVSKNILFVQLEIVTFEHIPIFIFDDKIIRLGMRGVKILMQLFSVSIMMGWSHCLLFFATYLMVSFQFSCHSVDS